MAGRSPGSKGPADLIAIRAGVPPMFIQLKARRSQPMWSAFPPPQRAALVELAARYGADAWYCYWRTGKPPVWVHSEDWPPARGRERADYVIGEGGCWIWAKARTADGYGAINRDGETLAHRWFYARENGPVPNGLQIDHLCGVRACVNPDHLEPVTQTENVRRGAVTKLRPAEVREIREAANAGDEGLQAIGDRYGIGKGHVWRIKMGLAWRDI